MTRGSRYDPALHGPHRVVGPGFHEEVFAAVRDVPPGRVTTYGDVAARLGRRGVARQVGWALAALPTDRDDVPWFRVVDASGRVLREEDGAPRREQVDRLAAEGVEVTDAGRVSGFAALRWSVVALLALLLAPSCGPASAGSTGETGAPAAASPDAPPPGMAWVPPGEFTMGWDGPEGRLDERPAHRVRLPGFWIDTTEVTNAQFAAFVEATGYVTTAEREIDWEELRRQLPPGTPKPPAEMLVPGSLVFTSPDRPVDLDDFGSWWHWAPGASWRAPTGPGSSIEGREDHPVVHVSWDDAVAYAAWAGKRLPTEAEWERAARFGADGSRFLWGDELLPDGEHRANIWQGVFPVRDDAEDGFAGVAPVGAFPPSELGLHDMAGNVWEWTADLFDARLYARRATELEPGGCCVDPQGPDASADPRNPHAPETRVQKGGSFLCHASYCESYRPSARMASTPDSGLSHVGFRCVWDGDPPEER